MSFQVGIGSLGAVFFQVGLCTPLRTMTSFLTFRTPSQENMSLTEHAYQQIK